MERKRETLMDEMELQDEQSRFSQRSEQRRQLLLETIKDAMEVKDDRFRFSCAWDQLHPSLLEMIVRRLTVPDYFRFPSVCRSWLKVHQENHSTISLECQIPWLLLFSASFSWSAPLFYSLLEKRLYKLPLPPLHPGPDYSYQFSSSSFGWLLMTKKVGWEGKLERLFLHPISGVEIKLPWYEGIWNGDLVALSSPPTDPACLVAVPRATGFAFCRLGDEVPQWLVCGPDPANANDYSMEFICDVALYGRRIYGITRDCNIVIQDYNNTDKFDKWDMDRGQLPSGYPFGYMKSLFVSQGEFFLVMSFDKNIQLIQNIQLLWEMPPDVDIQVFKADMATMAWVRVFNLGDRVVFLGENGSMLLSSTSVSRGCKMNRVYMAHPAIWCLRYWGLSPDSQWFMLEYDLTDGSIQYYQHPVGTKQTRSLIWVAPSVK